MAVAHNGRLERSGERILLAVLGYAAALVLLVLSLVADSDGEAAQYLFEGALIAAAATTGLLLRSIGARRN
jgi:hypothetical protein